MKIHFKKEVGNIGEEIAVEYLKNNNYKIIEKNFYCSQGEIDLTEKDKEEIVFIEVKTRTNINFGKPSEAVNEIKQKHMYKSAKYFLYKTKNLDKFIRFDVIEVLIANRKFNINHIKQSI
mgnify:CR=1 FL=1